MAEESAAGFAGQANGGVEGGAFGLAQQHFNVDTAAAGFLHGGTLTRGNRTVPNASSLFSDPPNPMRNMNVQQFTSHAPVVGGSQDQDEEEED